MKTYNNIINKLFLYISKSLISIFISSDFTSSFTSLTSSFTSLTSSLTSFMICFGFSAIDSTIDFVASFLTFSIVCCCSL